VGFRVDVDLSYYLNFTLSSGLGLIVSRVQGLTTLLPLVLFFEFRFR